MYIKYCKIFKLKNKNIIYYYMVENQLPKIDEKIHLINYGYSIGKSDRIRHKALNSACKDNDILTILKRLNLIRNYQSNYVTKTLFGEDVDYLKNKYKKIKYKKYKSQRGGKSDIAIEQNVNVDQDIDTDLKIDLEIENEINNENKNELDKENTDEIDNVSKNELDRENTDKIDTCTEVFETHKINNSIITFKTLTKVDYENIKNNYKKKKNLDQNSILIGLEKDKEICGYVVLLFNNEICCIVDFEAIKSYRSVFYLFIEKFLGKNNISRVIKKCNISYVASEECLNFWYSMGFLSYKVEKEKFDILLEKFL